MTAQPARRTESPPGPHRPRAGRLRRRSTDAASPRIATDLIRVPLGRRTRRAILTGHVLAAGTWLGVDVALSILVAGAALAGDPWTAGLYLRVLPVLLAPLLAVGLLTLTTGLLLGLGTRQGLLRHAWVAAKLAITVLYLVLIPLGLAPTVADRARHGQALLDRAATTVAVGDLAYPALAGPALLLTATALSVVKPRLRLRRRPASTT